MNKIKIVRLTSGEELIGEYSDKVSTGSTIELKKVGIIIPQEGTIGIMTYMPYTDIKIEQTFTIKEQHIMFIRTPAKDLIDSYNKFSQEIFNTIVMPESSKIIT